MSEKETEKKQVATPEELPLTYNQLAKLFLESQAALAEAIRDSRKPYESEATRLQKLEALKQRHEMIRIELSRRENAKKYCPHVREDNTPNIKWMQHSNGIVLGVCGECNSPFDSRNPEDLKLLRQDRMALKKMGRAGEHANRSYGALGITLPRV